MTPSLFGPLVMATVLGVLVTAAHRRFPPRLASQLVATTLVIIVATAAPSIGLTSLAYLAHLRLLGERFEWCVHALGLHDEIPWYLGVPATVAVAVGVWRAVVVMRRYRRLRHDTPGAVAITADDRPFAYTLPGRGGQVVLSTGLVAMLDEREQGVVLAHEQTHARHRHDRYLLVAHLSTAAIPFLRPLAGRLQFSIERWADETAVEHCGDRRLVANTLARVALRSAAPVGAPSFAGLGVSARVAALLAPPSKPLGRWARAGLWLAIGATAVIASFQLRYLAALIGTLRLG